MSATDAGFFFAEGENTPMHVGSVSVFAGPAPSYGDLVRLLLGKLPQVPRYRQRVRALPLHVGRPLWVDDEHFQILYHVRHTAVPRPGSAEQLRNLAGRVLGQRLDMAKPLWEVWLVEGLADDRWAIISKVHHCMVDGVAGTDLLQLLFNVDPNADHPEPPAWTPQADPATMDLVPGAFVDTVAHPVRRLTSLPSVTGMTRSAKQLFGSGRSLATAVPQLARQARTPLARTADRADRPVSAVGVDRRRAGGVQGGAHGPGGHAQRCRAHRDHPWLPGSAHRPRRAERRCRRPDDGAGVGPPAGRARHAEQPGVGGL